LTVLETKDKVRPMTDIESLKLDALWEEKGDHRVSPWYDEYMRDIDPQFSCDARFVGRVLPSGDEDENSYMIRNEEELDMNSDFALRCVKALVRYTEDNWLWEERE